jgi:hypothetical protein
MFPSVIIPYGWDVGNSSYEHQFNTSSVSHDRQTRSVSLCLSNDLFQWVENEY